MPGFLKNNWKLLVVFLIAFLAGWWITKSRGGDDSKYQIIQKRFDSVYSAIQQMKKDSAFKLRIDSMKVAAAAKASDSLQHVADNAEKMAEKWRTVADFNEEKFNELAALDPAGALQACKIGFASYDSFKVAVKAERSINVEQLHQKDLQIEGLNSALTTTTNLLQTTDSALSNEHTHGQRLTKDVIKKDKTIKRQGTWIKVLVGVAATAIVALLLVK